MRGEIIYKILDSLESGLNNQIDFTKAFLKAGYGASGGKINREYNVIQNKRIDGKLENEKVLKLQKYLSKLKRDGLILENESKQIYLSDKGKEKLNSLNNIVSPAKYFRDKKMGDKVVVISYDIPVAFNRERNILRSILQILGFNLVHKSVWVGKVSLPERFITDLSKLGILDYVEILEVAKNGTLKSKY